MYEAALLMLRFTDATTGQKSLVVSVSALEAYFLNFSALAREFPECWHLLCKADDRCRGEHFARTARQKTLQWGHAPSWSDVFIAAAEADRWWDREVRRPAITFVARGTKAVD